MTYSATAYEVNNVRVYWPVEADSLEAALAAAKRDASRYTFRVVVERDGEKLAA